MRRTLNDLFRAYYLGQTTLGPCPNVLMEKTLLNIGPPNTLGLRDITKQHWVSKPKECMDETCSYSNFGQESLAPSP